MQARGPPVLVRGLQHKSGDLQNQGTFYIGLRTSCINQGPHVWARGPPYTPDGIMCHLEPPYIVQGPPVLLKKGFLC